MLDNITFNSPFSSVFTSSDRDSASLHSRQLAFSGCDFSWQHYNRDSYKRYEIQQPAELANATAKRHSEFIAGRYCAAQAIQRLCHHPLSASRTQIPMLPDRSPLWPEGIIGSISHSGERAIAVVGSTRNYAGLGIDCETLSTNLTTPEIADLVLNPREQALLLDQNQEYGFLLTLAFSAKESLFKALSPTVSALPSFHDLSIRRIGAKNILLSPSAELTDNWPGNTEFAVDYTTQSAHILTIATLETVAADRC